MKTILLKDAVAMIPDGATVMIGGFMGVGTPERLIDELVRQGRRNLTVIANDNALPGVGIGKLMSAGAGQQDHRQPHRPQPRDAEEDARRRARGRARAAGDADRAHPRRRLRARRRADADRCRHGGRARASSASRSTASPTCWRRRCAPISLSCSAFLADYLGNLYYALTARNFNPVIAMAADTVIAEAAEHRAGRRDCARPRHDAGTARRLHRFARLIMDAQNIIAKRIARELRDGMLVNLGIGIPTLVANYVPSDMHVYLSVGERPDRHGRPARRRDARTRVLTDAGGQPSARCPVPPPSTAPCPSA